MLDYVRTGLKLEAWDYAGNHTEVTVEPPAEDILPLGAVWRKHCEALARRSGSKCWRAALLRAGR